MNNAKDVVTQYIDALHTAREVIAEAYHAGTVTLNDATQRKIRMLQQHRAIVPYMHDEFRLSSSLNGHLDIVAQRWRNFDIPTNFVEQIERLPHLIDEYLKASREDRIDDRDTYATDFDAAVFDLAEGIIGALMKLRTLTENNFANVSTLAEKTRQNDFYTAKSRTLTSLLNSAQFQEIADELATSELLAPLNAVFKYQIGNQLSEWRSTITDINKILLAYLFRLRVISADAKQIRSLALFLRKNPDYQFAEVADKDEMPAWARKYRGMSVRAHPDFAVNATREVFAEVARAVPEPKMKTSKERPAGTLFNAAPPSVIVLQQKPEAVALRLFTQVAMASASPVSAIEWLRRHDATASLDAHAWLLYAWHALHAQLSRKRGAFNMKRELWPDAYSYSGNLMIRDLYLWKSN